MSEQSKYYRFFAPYPELSERDVARFTQVDYHQRLALIVTVGDEMIGVGRYEGIGRRTAEEVVSRYAQDHGDWPRSVVIDLWGSASMRTGGELTEWCPFGQTASRAGANTVATQSLGSFISLAW